MESALTEKVVPELLTSGRFEHVAGALDQQPSWLLRKVITLLSARVSVEDDVVQKIRELAQAGPVVYALKYRSVFDIHFLRLRFAQLGLPVPAYVFGMSAAANCSLSKVFKVLQHRLKRLFHGAHGEDPSDESVLQEIFSGKGGAAVLFLVDEQTSRARYIQPQDDPLDKLLDMQGRLAGSIALLPMFILYDRTPKRTVRPFWETFLGDPDRPGVLKRLVTSYHEWTKPEVLIGQPIHLLSEFEEFGSDKSWEELPFGVREELIASINERIRVNRGPEKRSRTEIKEMVLQDQRVLKGVREAAAKEGVPEQKVRKQAEKYVQEIAADQHLQIHHFLYYVLRWMFARVFDGVDMRASDFSVLKRANAKGSLIFVSCHKSHFDYLIVGYLAFINQMAVPHMAAGKNLSFWPVGPLLRNGGAFFIRRSFRGLVLYTHVFAAYLKVLIREKININFYIEGGRSRTGKLLPPRVGMLAFLLQAVEEGDVEDLTFVPTFIGYDQIPEENAYLRELAGREKQSESFLAFLRAREVLAKSFGKVYVRFHRPMSLKAFMNEWTTDPGKLSTKESRKLLTDFAYRLMHGIVKIGVVSPIELVAAGILSTGDRTITHAKLAKAINYFSTALRHDGYDFAATLEAPEKAIETTIGLFRMRNFVNLDDASKPNDEPTYRITDSGIAHLAFYRNGLVNYLWPASFFSMALLKQPPDSSPSFENVRTDFEAIKQLFSKEFITDPLVSCETMLQQTRAFFSQQGWIKDDGPVNVEVLQLFRGLLSDLAELYYLVLVTAGNVGESGTSQKDFIKKMSLAAQEFHKDRPESTIPSLPSVTVGNAMLRFSEMDIFEYRQSKKFLKGVGNHQQKEAVQEFLLSLIR
jgi:glycerol-3-phosphate O-acyltransferase